MNNVTYFFIGLSINYAQIKNVKNTSKIFSKLIYNKRLPSVYDDVERMLYTY